MSELNPSEETLFATLAQLPAPERAARLEAACGRDAALRERLELLLAAHDRVSQFMAQPVTPAAPRDAAFAIPVAERLGDSIGPYKLLQRIGEGGCGVVYMAQQDKPVRRLVALKVIKLGMDTRAVVARFEAERQALALMDHPNIAKVLDAGATETGRPFFVMELVRGIKITEYCDHNQLTTAQRLELFIQVCRAVQHAHQKGVIHRDLKPSNILVTTNDGVPVPKVIDFGIAKATQGPLTDKTLVTAFEQFIGTPAYVSPEQAVMTIVDIDTRSDIYSMGVLLYELLAGKTPFDTQQLLAAGLDEMRRTIREQQPQRPSTRLSALDAADQTTVAKARRTEPTRLTSLLKGDLDWIVMKCLEKDRARRYETANGLAMDIERYLRHEPVVARPPSRLYEFQKSVRRHRLGFAAAAIVSTTLAVAAWVSTRQAVQARHAELAARQRAYAADMNSAQQGLAENNLGRVMDVLNAQRPAPGQKDLRGWEWRYLWQQTRSDALFTLCRQSSHINSLASSADGKWLAIGAYLRGGLSVWDLQHRQELVRLAEPEKLIRAAFSPTGPLLAFAGFNPSAPGGQQHLLHLWNASTRVMLAEFPLDGPCMGLAFSRDGARLATSSAGRDITLWHMPDGTKLASYPCQQVESNLGTGFAATPTLSLAAFGMPGQQICVMDLRQGKVLWSANATKDRITALAFSPDETVLASAAGVDESDIRLWSVASGHELIRLQGHLGSVFSLLFWPDGRTLASASTDATIRIWDVPGQKSLTELRGHSRPVWCLALLPDGRTLVSGSKDGTVCVWDTSVAHPRDPRVTTLQNTLAWCFAPDSQSIVTFDRRGRVTRWSGAAYQQQESLMETGSDGYGNPSYHRFSPAGHFLATGSTNGLVQIWDVTERVLLRGLKHAPGIVRAQAFLRDGNRLITWSARDNVLHDWDLTTGSEIQSWPAPILMDHAISLSADEQACLALGYDGNAVLRNLPRQRSLLLNLAAEYATDATFSRNGKLLAVASGAGYAGLWETADWRLLATLGGFPRYVESVAFSPDGTRLATGSLGKEAVKLWDTASTQNVLTLEGQGALFFSTAFSPDGNAIGSLNQGGALHLWSAPAWGEIEAAEAESDKAGRAKYE